MNGAVYTKLQDMSEALLKAAEQDDEPLFMTLYAELEKFCQGYKGGKQDHPALWETLADFSDENERAIELYEQAFLLADELKENEYKGSIQFSLGQRLLEIGSEPEAKRALLKAQKFASFTDDEDLVADVDELLATLDE